MRSPADIGGPDTGSTASDDG